jgi:hypothetical protein
MLDQLESIPDRAQWRLTGVTWITFFRWQRGYLVDV